MRKGIADQQEKDNAAIKAKLDLDAATQKMEDAIKNRKSLPAQVVNDARETARRAKDSYVRAVQVRDDMNKVNANALQHAGKSMTLLLERETSSVKLGRPLQESVGFWLDNNSNRSMSIIYPSNVHGTTRFDFEYLREEMEQNHAIGSSILEFFIVYIIACLLTL